MYPPIDPSRALTSRLGGALGLLFLLGLVCSEALAGVPATWTYVDGDGVAHSFAYEQGACNNVTDGGTIGSDVIGCANPTYQPPALSSVTTPSGGAGELEYAWMATTTDPASGGRVAWQIIPNTDAPDFTPGPLTQTTYFMRCARRAGCSEYAGETNYVTVEIDCCDNVTDGGAIDGDQANCGVPFDPATIRSTTAASGGSNALRYEWYVSTTTDVYAVRAPGWSPIAGATSAFYNPGPITEVTHYVRTARREFCTETGAYSNVVTVRATPLAELEITATPVSCHDATDGTVEVTIVSSAEPSTRRWLDDPTTDLRRTGLAPGDYTLELTDANGCVTQVTAAVDAPDELTATAEAEFDICAFAGDATVRAVVDGGTPPYSYAWNGGQTAAELTNQSAGTYIVDVTDANGCTANASVEVNPPPAFTTSSTFTDPVCYQDDGTIDVATNGGTAPFTFVWSHDPGFTASSATGLAGGDYVITVTDANGCGSIENVSLDDTPAIQITLETDEISCNGANDGNIRSTVTGGLPPYTYAWDDGATTADLNGVGPGTYVLTVTDANGCDVDEAVTLTEPDPIVAGIRVIQPVCREDGGTLIAEMTGGTPPYTFFWGTVGRANETTLNNQPPGDYELIVTDASGCSDTATAAVEDVPLLEIAETHNDATCPSSTDGDATALPTGGQAPYSYRWDDPATQTTQTATGLAPGTYTATVTDDRGCVKDVTVVVGSLSPGPQITTDVTQVSCNGADDASIDQTVTGGPAPYTYAWTDDGVASAVTTQDRSGLAPGTYEVTVTDALGCEADAAYTINEPVELEVVATPTSFYPNYFNVSRYEATDGEAGATVTGGTGPYTYEWTQGGSIVGATQNVDDLAGDTVAVTVTDASGCVATHDTVLIEPNMISDFVWEDANGNGIQDPGEPGLEGVEIRLTGRDDNNIAVSFTTFSDANGNYRFDQLPPGNYTIFMRRLPGYEYSPADQGSDDALDSDIDLSNVIRLSIVGFGNGDFDVDGGFIPSDNSITISDFAWYDTNHDGVQNPFEGPAPGVTLRLVRAADGVVIDSTLTDEDGNYAFNDVIPGEYYINADPSTSTLDSSFVLTFPAVGPDRSLDSDFNPLTLRSSNITVTVTSTDIDDIDLGLHEDCDLALGINEIAGDEDVCAGDLPSLITSDEEPVNATQYDWYRSPSPNYRGPNDPNWTRAGATQINYQPAALPTTNYYLRLASTAGCEKDFTSASNIISKVAVPAPSASIAAAQSTPDNDIGDDSGIVMCRTNTLAITADSTEPVVFYWDFGVNAIPRYDTGRTVSGIEFTTVGPQTVTLRTVNPDGCDGTATYDVQALNCFNGGSLIEGLAAVPSLQGNTITWDATSLRKGTYFDVQRAVGKQAYQDIGRVKARHLGSRASYTYTDQYAPGGELAYRITHVVPSFPAGHTEVVRVRSARTDLLTRVFPNPVSHDLTVEVASVEQGEVTYELINAYGARVYRGVTIAGRSRLEMGDLPTGTYHLRLIAPDGDSEVQTILKQ